MAERTTYDIAADVLAKADDKTKAKLVNVQHIELLKNLLADVSVAVKHMHVVARVLDFIEGLNSELLQDLKTAGVLVEKVTPASTETQQTATEIKQ